MGLEVGRVGYYPVWFAALPASFRWYPALVETYQRLHSRRRGTSTARPLGDSVTPICNKPRIMTAGTFDAINHSEGWVGELMCAETESYTKPVGSYDANAWGIYDTLGNLWEWVSDCAAPDHSKLPTDGSPQTAANGGECDHRLTKGGAFYSRTWLARPATRGDGQEGDHRPVA